MDNLASFLWLNDSSAQSEPNNINATLISDECIISAQQDNGGDGDYSPGAQGILNFLNLYYLGAVIIVGVLGNGRNIYLFIVLMRKEQLTSPSYYLAALALADYVFLVTLFLLWLGHFVGTYLLDKPGFYEFLFYLSSTSSCISAWLVAAFTFERFIVVRYPLKRSKLCTVRRAKIIIGCLTIAAFIIQIVGLLPTGVVAKASASDNSSSTVNSSSSAHQPVSNRELVYYEVMRILNMLETGMTQVVPPVLIVVMNALIILSLFRQLNKTFKNGELNKHLSTASSTTKKQSKQDIKELVNVKTPRDDTQINVDEIDTGVIEHRPPSSLNTLENAVSLIAAGNVDCQSQKQHKSNSNGIKVKVIRRLSKGTEYAITKKLVLISSVHILLNLPSYAGNIKNFIDETIGSDNVNTILTTWYFQQFAMVLYCTSFSIHFLLYPSNSDSRFSIRHSLVNCCCRTQMQII